MTAKRSGYELTETGSQVYVLGGMEYSRWYGNEMSHAFRSLEFDPCNLLRGILMEYTNLSLTQRIWLCFKLITSCEENG